MDINIPSKPEGPYCSFCGKDKEEVEVLVRGPNEVYICDECVALCMTHIATHRGKKSYVAEMFKALA